MDRLRTVELDRILVSGRVRQDLGDLDALAASIRDVGLLQPIVLDSCHKLVAGERRLEAVKLLGWKDIPAYFPGGVDELASAVLAERDENTCRKEFTPEEAAYAAERIEEVERGEAKERQKEHGGTAPGRKKENTSAESAEVIPPSSRQTRVKVADAVGMSHDTLNKATKVVKARDAEPEKYQPLVDKMNETGKVDGVYKKLQALQAAEQVEQVEQVDEQVEQVDEQVASEPHPAERPEYTEEEKARYALGKAIGVAYVGSGYGWRDDHELNLKDFIDAHPNLDAIPVFIVQRDKLTDPIYDAGYSFTGRGCHVVAGSIVQLHECGPANP
jgi:ParB family chromosome partitioning protein